MVQQTLAKEILGKIINESIPFSLALKSAFKHNNTPREERAVISAIVGCVLRHYLVMDKIVKLAYPEMDNEGVILALIALSNALFIKKLDQEKCQEATNAFIKENEPPIETFIESYLSERKLVPEGIEVGSHEFLSYRYNTPINIVKMWYKQFGHISTTKILRANSRPPQVVVRINNNSIDDESFFTQFVDFEKIEGISGVALYRGETKFKNHAVREKRLASPLSLAYKEMFDEGDVDLLKGLAIYSEYPNDIFNELLSRFPTLDNIEYIANNLNTCNNVKRFLARNNIHRGVNVYEAQASSIITCVSKPVHTFLVMPDNSHLNLLQLLPDYFLRFDMEKLDELIANQKVAIREASAQVEDGGYLLYLVDTISKKESSAVINDFLNEHRDFSLVRDKQYFPYKKYGCSYYFAVLKKVKWMINLYGQEIKKLIALMEQEGQKPYRATQLYTWLYQHRVQDFDEMSDISKSFREVLKQKYSLSIPSVHTKQVSEDGTIKLLLNLEDDYKVECVLMRYNYGNAACVSSQVGCNMGCSFCSSGILGKQRNLTASEMVGQILILNQILKQENKGQRVTHVVVMGTGEPFDNYDNVLDFIKIVNHPKGLAIGARHITVSTCGIVEGIYRYADEHLQTNLAISLHAPNDELRDKLMKINRAYPLDKVMKAIRYYEKETKRRVTYEYLLIEGINDTKEHAKQLVELIRGTKGYVNLIPYNETNKFPEFSRPSGNRIHAFLDYLMKSGVKATIRKEFGSDIDAACGQLKAISEELVHE